MDFRDVRTGLVIDRDCRFYQRSPRHVNGASAFGRACTDVAALSVYVEFILAMGVCEVLRACRVFDSFRTESDQDDIGAVFYIYGVAIFICIEAVFHAEFAQDSDGIIVYGQGRMLQFSVADAAVGPDDVSLR